MMFITCSFISKHPNVLGDTSLNVMIFNKFDQLFRVNKKSASKDEVKSGTVNSTTTTNNNNSCSSHNNNHKPFHGDVGNVNEDGDDRQKLMFYCQQAQGSVTGVISGFNNVKELYQKISECYKFDPSESPILNIRMKKALQLFETFYLYRNASQILFCTLNTHKVNMNKLLGAQIALNDFIFVHRKGRPKEVELTKKEEALGLTITDNGNGLAFIKRIKPGSVIDEIPVIQVGDHIEKINNESLVGKRHFEVAKYLKEIPLGSTFTLRLISPLQAGFYNIGPREDRGKGKKASYGSGKETLRFKASGAAVIEVVDDDVTFQKAVDGINKLLENYLGINDSELASRIWELSEGKKNNFDFLQALTESDINELGFSDDFIFELWGVITDVRDGRL